MIVQNTHEYANYFLSRVFCESSHSMATLEYSWAPTVTREEKRLKTLKQNTLYHNIKTMYNQPTSIINS